MVDIEGTKSVVIFVIIAVVAGLLGGLLATSFLANPNPQGVQGETSPQGSKGDTGDAARAEQH